MKLRSLLSSAAFLSTVMITTPSYSFTPPLPEYVGPRQITQARVEHSDLIRAWRLGEEGEIQSFCNNFTTTNEGIFFLIPDVYECYFPILPDDKFLISKDKLNEDIHMFLNRGQSVCWAIDFRYQFDRCL